MSTFFNLSRDAFAVHFFLTSSNAHSYYIYVAVCLCYGMSLVSYFEILWSAQFHKKIISFTFSSYFYVKIRFQQFLLLGVCFF